MNSSTLTIKGQVTIPKHLRDYLGLSPGDKVGFELTEDGAVRIVAPRKPALNKGAETSRFTTLRGTRKTGMSTKPRVDHLRGAVWEVRTSLPKRIARTLFAVESGVMVLLHGFIKKTQVTSGSEIELAEKRFKGWKHGEN